MTYESFLMFHSILDVSSLWTPAVPSAGQSTFFGNVGSIASRLCIRCGMSVIQEPNKIYQKNEWWKGWIFPMLNKPDFPIRIFYDGSCSVCAAEIERYLVQDHAGKLVAVDISASDFDPERFRTSLHQFMSELHVIDHSGRVYRGVEAFWAIWQAFPADRVLGLLATLLTMPLINPVARLCYKGFARIRSYLPKRHRCSDGTCRIDKKH